LGLYQRESTGKVRVLYKEAMEELRPFKVQLALYVHPSESKPLGMNEPLKVWPHHEPVQKLGAHPLS
jgi:hypothetical protein